MKPKFFNRFTTVLFLIYYFVTSNVIAQDSTGRAPRWTVLASVQLCKAHSGRNYPYSTIDYNQPSYSLALEYAIPKKILPMTFGIRTTFRSGYGNDKEMGPGGGTSSSGNFKVLRSCLLFLFRLYDDKKIVLTPDFTRSAWYGVLEHLIHFHGVFLTKPLITANQ